MMNVLHNHGDISLCIKRHGERDTRTMQGRDSQNLSASILLSRSWIKIMKWWCRVEWGWLMECWSDCSACSRLGFDGKSFYVVAFIVGYVTFCGICEARCKWVENLFLRHFHSFCSHWLVFWNSLLQIPSTSWKKSFTLIFHKYFIPFKFSVEGQTETHQTHPKILKTPRNLITDTLGHRWNGNFCDKILLISFHYRAYGAPSYSAFPSANRVPKWALIDRCAFVYGFEGIAISKKAKINSNRN